jgi:hypothetical protein
MKQQTKAGEGYNLPPLAHANPSNGACQAKNFSPYHTRGAGVNKKMRISLKDAKQRL